MNRKILATLVMGVGVGLIAAPAAAAISWDFTSGTTQGGAANTYGNTRYKTVDGVMVTASAWSNTVGSANTFIESAYLGAYGGSGLGVTNRDGANNADTNEGTPTNTISPEHAIDNNGRNDAVLLHFSSAVNLLSVAIGWKDTDADISVLASNGAPLAGVAYGNGTSDGLVGAGWNIIGSYANLSTSSATSISNTTFATDWLIMAYYPSFGSGGSGFGGGNDYFKLSAVTGVKRPPGSAPEPGTALLLGAAMVGGLWSRRRGTRK